MIEEQAVVVAVDENFAWVETQRKTACSSCSANKGCGTATLSKVLGSRQNQVKVLNPVGATVGDTVILSLRESAMVKGAAILYLTPLAFMLGFAVFVELWFQPGTEGSVILAGLLGLGLGLGVVRLFSRSIAKDSRYQAVISKRIPADPSSAHGVFSP
ncbi:MAG: SoxR reducing system RseC family protein [bacterium]